MPRQNKPTTTTADNSSAKNARGDLDHTERPILFNDEMVRAILDGRKTQTRRVMKVQPPNAEYRIGTCVSSTVRGEEGKHHWVHVVGNDYKDVSQPYFRNPYGTVGDRLWVREAFANVPTSAYRHSTGIVQMQDPDDGDRAVVYRENFDRSRDFPWKPSIHMPRWASRITLEITGIRVERLQDISLRDVYEEGVKAIKNGCLPFSKIWDSINAKRGYSWESNPWVWVIEFKRAA